MSSRLADPGTVPGVISAIVLTITATVSLNCGLVIPRQGWNGDWGPLVPHETFPGDCGICHVRETWEQLRPDFSFDHEEETGHALEGVHARASCLRCHNDRGPVQAYVARGCGGCHVDPHRSALGVDCRRCHNQNSWRPDGLVAEHARTRFPLVGMHSVTPCEACHPQAPVGDFRGAPTSCALCHRNDALRVASPNHLGNGWTTGCESCHGPLGFDRASFTHGFFPLSGGHGALDCTRCHTGSRFGGLSSDCYACHRADYQQAPDHVALAYPTDCTRCHSISGWQGAVVNHSFFPLVGGHGGLQCAQCHTTGTFTPLSTACYSCHQSDYQAQPDHVANGFSTDCTGCHNVFGWD